MRLLPLHPRQIPGRMDMDTFFVSVKSIRGFKAVQIFHSVQSGYTYCVGMHQIFHSVQSGYTYCVGMQREANAHSAYQDFIREVGAPNQLLSDNAWTLTQKKFTWTSRQYAIQQLHTTPHNPQQNTAERKLAVVKGRVVLTLRLLNAPLVFWCYCMQWVLDCLNHTALRKLGWRTPFEKMFGNTPDISMFRYVFWEAVLYYDPMATFPKSRFRNQRFSQEGLLDLHGSMAMRSPTASGLNLMVIGLAEKS